MSAHDAARGSNARVRRLPWSQRRMPSSSPRSEKNTVRDDILSHRDVTVKMRSAMRA